MHLSAGCQFVISPASAGAYTTAVRESDLIQSIVAANARLPGHVTIPPGDDMAALSLGGSDLLVAADQVIDGVHVDLQSAPIEKAGRKAVCRNLSDVAAMAARPVGMVCCVVLPRGLPEGEARRLSEAVRVTGERYGCPLVGGDTAIHGGPLTLSITVLAEPAGIEPVTRQGARPGDLLYVTGRLGGTQIEYEGSVRHLDFEPRVEFARALAGDGRTRPNAMIDLSDGLARDLLHLTPDAVVAVEDLPVAPAAVAAGQASGQPAYRHALGDGEDHELLLAVPAERAADVEEVEMGGLGLTRVGQVTAEGGLVVTRAGEPVGLTGLGWEHHDA